MVLNAKVWPDVGILKRLCSVGSAKKIHDTKTNIDRGIYCIYASMTDLVVYFQVQRKTLLLRKKIPVKMQSFYFHYLSFKHNMSESFVCVPSLTSSKKHRLPFALHISISARCRGRLPFCYLAVLAVSQHALVRSPAHANV